MRQLELVLCYSLEKDHIANLRRRIDTIAEAAEAADVSTFAYVRDCQHWDVGEADYKVAVETVFSRIRSADAVLLDLTADSDASRTGLCLEAGYARALYKRVGGLWRRPDRPTKILSVVDIEASYDGSDDGLRDSVASVLGRLLGERRTVPRPSKQR